MVTAESIAEIKDKLGSQEWARRTYASGKAALAPWLAASSAKLRQVFPTRRGNVYHNFSCPQDRCRLVFDPFESAQFKCPLCGKSFAPETDAGIYPPGDRYHGTMYDGWACLFYETAGSIAADMGVVGRVEPADAGKYFQRGVEILLLYADTIERLQTKFDKDRQMSVLLTYHREGDSTVLKDLALAYELLRDAMTAEQRARFERVVLQRMLDDLMLERIYTYNHNNLYQWHRTILQTALALERDDLIDWCFGYGAWTPEREPEHHSVRRLLATHFKPDGAYWEMCSGYHLYPLDALCQLAVVSRQLSAMDRERFPARQYDLTDPSNPGGQVIRNALEWFMGLAMPDRTMPTIGDSMAPARRHGRLLQHRRGGLPLLRPEGRGRLRALSPRATKLGGAALRRAGDRPAAAPVHQFVSLQRLGFAAPRVARQPRLGRPQRPHPGRRPPARGPPDACSATCRASFWPWRRPRPTTTA